MKYTTVLFDLDGTLTKSEEGITKTAIYAAEKMGFTGFTQEQFKVFIGPPLFDSFRTVVGMTDEQANRAIDYYHERFERVGWAENEVYAGIPRCFAVSKKRRARGDRHRKAADFRRAHREKFGFAPYLDDVIGPGLDNKDSSKAALVRRGVKAFGGSVVMVGDRCFDIEGGRANGVDTVGVCYGYGTEEELVSADATHIAHTVEELTDILIGDAPRARGVFISMEGMDGCGKTTQRAALTEHLQKLGWRVTATREPGGDEVAEKIRNLLLDPANQTMCDETEAYLYAAGRAQNVRAVVRPALERGDAVVCDRFVDSSVAYQGAGRQLGMEQIAALNAMAVGETRPDITVYLRMPADVALSELSASKPDRLEQQKADFFSRTYQAYERLFAEQEKRVLTVNAAQSIEQVTQTMLDGLDERLDGLEV
ncbi:MAG: dTMP kinase [Christensenellales bacterium]